MVDENKIHLELKKMEISDPFQRLQIIKQIGEGSFSKIYQVQDKKQELEIVLKLDKHEKFRNISKHEYMILKEFQDLDCVPRVYDFIENPGYNAILMELLGTNISEYKLSKGKSLSSIEILDILIQMLTAIEKIHNKGFIHCDIKPSNFVLSLDEKKVFLIDFGLTKLHLNILDGTPFEKKENVGFKGTIAFASVNSHQNQDLSRRDDLWSFFFTILELMDENLPWKSFPANKELIGCLKEQCVQSPEKYLLRTNCKNIEFLDIFYHIKSLNYEDKPNYNFIRNKLQSMLFQKANYYVGSVYCEMYLRKAYMELIKKNDLNTENSENSFEKSSKKKQKKVFNIVKYDKKMDINKKILNKNFNDSNTVDKSYSLWEIQNVSKMYDVLKKAI